MKFDINCIKHLFLPGAIFSVVALVALFAQPYRNWLLPILFLLLPFIDSQWCLPRIPRSKLLLFSWTTITVIISVLLYQNTQLMSLFAVMVLVAAVPEEWFFRAYLQKRLGNSVLTILLVSLLFALMHYITSTTFQSLLVFIPSIFFGWVYKKTDDVVLVVLLHSLSNLLFYIYGIEIYTVIY